MFYEIRDNNGKLSFRYQLRFSAPITKRRDDKVQETHIQVEYLEKLLHLRKELPVPEGKVNAAYIEVGDFDASEDECPIEGTFDLVVFPDDTVWVKIADNSNQLPNE